MNSRVHISKPLTTGRVKFVSMLPRKFAKRSEGPLGDHGWCRHLRADGRITCLFASAICALPGPQSHNQNVRPHYVSIARGVQTFRFVRGGGPRD